MANPLTAASLNLAEHVKEGVWQKDIKGGVIASLAPQAQFLYGDTDIYTFTSTPKAELVGEGGNKSSEEYAPTTVTAKTYKLQLTYRFTDELKYADEDYQLGVLDSMSRNILTAASRSIDLLGIHGINPKTGLVSDSVSNYIMKASNGVSRVETLDLAAQALQTNGYVANGIAFDPVYAGKLARTKQAANNNVPLYPELGFGFGFDSFQGLRAVSSDTVSGLKEITYAEDADIPQAIMADWSAFQWGIVRNVPLHLIEYGDPDGAGDLQRKNQIAIRAEVLIAFAIMDGNAFAVVYEDAPASV